MTARDEIKAGLYEERYVDQHVANSVDDLLDAYANEVVRNVADMLSVAWRDNFFGVHENDGVYEAAEWLRSVSVTGGVLGYHNPEYPSQSCNPMSGDES